MQFHILLKKKKYCSSIFLDISQTFDSLARRVTVQIKTMFTSNLLIKSYLSDRRFQVRFGSSFSGTANINAGVPQGGILSPVLYNIYASDQPTSRNTTVAEFADDKAIITIDSNPINVPLNLQNNLEKKKVIVVSLGKKKKKHTSC